MSVARFIAGQRTNYRVPNTVVCALSGVSVAWFYKWLGRAAGPSAASGLHTPRDRCRETIDRAVKVMFTRKRGLHGSPRLHADLLDDGREVSEKTVADSMRRQGLIARRIQRRNGLAGQDKTAPKFPDLCWDFTAGRHNIRWVGEMTEIPTGPDRKGFEAVSGDRDRSLQPPVARRRRPGCARTPNRPVRRSRWLWPHAADRML